ncbi:MAG: hypothetical protein ACOC80_04995 [Petrotogales bacterium]
MQNLYLTWGKDLKFTRQKLRGTRDYYMDVHEKGGGRFSKRAAEDFLDLLISNFMNQNIPGPELSEAYKKYKQKQGAFEEKGFFSSEMVGALGIFRTRSGGDPTRHGWAAGIARTSGEDAFNALKLFWFETGTSAKGGRWKAGPQPERPVFATTLEEFMNTKFPGLVHEMHSIHHIWGKGKK